MSQIFVTGIDTDAGKSYATGHLANYLTARGESVITMKFIQTGNRDFSEDIDVHRRIMGIGMQPVDLDHTTAPIIFTYPASPQLAARIDGREINLTAIDNARAKLASLYDTVLIEGAGGPMVPLTDDFLTIDYATTRQLPVALVTNGKLGSISSTLMAIESIKHRGLELRYLLYNTFLDTDATIVADTRGFLERYIARNTPTTTWIDVPKY